MGNQPVNNSEKNPYVFNAAEADAALYSLAENRIKNKDLSFRWPAEFKTLLNLNALPLYPGQVLVIHACPGEGKSVLGAWFIKQFAQKIKTLGGQNSYAFHVMLEETVEIARTRTMSEPVDFDKIASGEADLSFLRVQFSKSITDPILYMGPSIMGGIIHPDAAEFTGVSAYQIGLAAYALKKEYGYQFAGVVLDYIQLMQDKNRSQKRYEQVTNASMEIISMAKNIVHCPVIALAQSKQGEVKSRANKMPGLEDIQHSSQISQDADATWSLWSPAKDLPLYSVMRIDDLNIPVLRDLVFVKMLKWRGCGQRTDGQSFILSMGDPVGNLFEVDKYDLANLDVGELRAKGIKRFVETLQPEFRSENGFPASF